MRHYLSTLLRAILDVTVQDMGTIYQRRAAKRFGGRFLQILKSSPLAHEAKAILSAHYHIVTLAASSTFQPRRHEYYFSLTLRVQGDGLCAVDVIHMYSVVHDTASNHDISVATKAVMDQCVFVETRGPRPRTPFGGLIKNVGWYIFLSSPQRLKA